MRASVYYIAVCILALTVSPAFGRICPKCGRDHLPDVKPPAKEEPKTEPKQEPEPPKVEPKTEQEQEPETVESLAVARERFWAPSVEIADEADRILDRLTERYGRPKVWRPFPIYFRQYRGDGVAGYTLYSAPKVQEVVVYESFENSRGGTLDHELTHAFFFYFLGANFDLFLNEGLAQNSEYRRREALRQTVYRRYSSGEFWELSDLYGRNRYDGGLLIYHEGFSVVDFLIGRGGSQWFSAFMTELVRTNDINACLRRFYGYKNLVELQTAWHAYIERGQDRKSLRAIN